MRYQLTDDDMTANGAGFVARAFSGNKPHLILIMKQAIESDDKMTSHHKNTVLQDEETLIERKTDLKTVRTGVLPPT